MRKGICTFSPHTTQLSGNDVEGAGRSLGYCPESTDGSGKVGTANKKGG